METQNYHVFCDLNRSHSTSSIAEAVKVRDEFVEAGRKAYILDQNNILVKEKQFLVTVGLDYEPEDGDQMEALLSALEHFEIPTYVQELAAEAPAYGNEFLVHYQEGEDEDCRDNHVVTAESAEEAESLFLADFEDRDVRIVAVYQRAR